MVLSNRILLKESQVPGAIIFVVVSSRGEKAVNWERGNRDPLTASSGYILSWRKKKLFNLGFFFFAS